jgi:hypothetical protein
LIRHVYQFGAVEPMPLISITQESGGLFGADEYIVKPMEKATLLAFVERCLNNRRQTGQARPILVVEDDTPTRCSFQDSVRRRLRCGRRLRSDTAVRLPAWR